MHSGYWQRASDIGSDVYRHRQIENVDEQAGPAYFATSGLSRWLFWQRLKWAMSQIGSLGYEDEKTQAGSLGHEAEGTQAGSLGYVAMDFGCGFGLLLPHLRQHFGTTIAVDLMPSLAEEFMRRWDQHPEVTNAPGQSHGQLRIVGSLPDAQLPLGSVDLIVALDVLEHFESLDSIVDQLTSLLKPTGHLLVSGPTESWLYKLGRRLVGFSGEYHHQTIYDVHAALEQKCQPVFIKQLPPLLPLFLVSIWKIR